MRAPLPFGKTVKGIHGRHDGQTRYRVRCPPFATDLGAPQRMRLCAISRHMALQQIRRRFRPLAGANKQRGNEVTTRRTLRATSVINAERIRNFDANLAIQERS
jgi:hypothetical protein